jgi:sulfite reductase (NADPH) hemoprotein beta-component
MPAGVCTAEQWQAINNISDTRGNGTFKLTTRQTFQFHGIIKADLKPAIQMINKAMLDTIAACGDVNRNVMCSCNPSLGPIHAQISEFAKNISEHLMPRTNAYAEIWLDKKLVAGDAVKDVEPMYGPYYLPRKFKIAIAVPPTNDTDVFCHDVGFIAIVSPEGTLQGFNVTIGGGMGVTHSMKKTYPRLGTVIGFITPEQGCAVAEKIMLVQRDHGDRTNRKHARLKYTVDDMSVEGFKKAVEDRLGWKLAPERAYKFERNVDQFGWQTGWDGRKHFTCFIENGRVEDTPSKQFKTGLLEVAKAHKGVFRCVTLPDHHGS